MFRRDSSIKHIDKSGYFSTITLIQRVIFIFTFQLNMLSLHGYKMQNLLFRCNKNMSSIRKPSSLFFRTRGGFVSSSLSSLAAIKPISFSSDDASLHPIPSPAIRLQNLREVMLNEGIDCFVIPTEDPHMSEYTALYYNRREYISGFTGSAGTAIVTQNQALLFTDGRYHNQASLELSR